MKRIYIVTACIVVLLMMVGCGAKQKMEDKLAETLVEKALGTGVDIDGEEVTLEGEDGSITFGSDEWPDTDLAEKVPKFKDGVITSVINSEAYVFILMEEVNDDDFQDYFETVKSKYTEGAYESKFEDTVAYSGSDSEGITVVLSYTMNDKALSIQASMPEKTE